MVQLYYKKGMSALEELADLLQNPTSPVPTQAPAAADKQPAQWYDFKIGNATVPFSNVMNENATLPGLSFPKELALRTYSFSYLAATSLASANTGGYFAGFADALLDCFRSKCVTAACQGSQWAGMEFVIDANSLASVSPTTTLWGTTMQRLWAKSVLNPDGHVFLRRFRDRVVSALNERACLKGFSSMFLEAPLFPSRLDMKRELGPGDWNQYIDDLREYDPSSVKIVVKIGTSWTSSSEHDWATRHINCVRIAHKRRVDAREAAADKKPRYEAV